MYLHSLDIHPEGSVDNETSEVAESEIRVRLAYFSIP